MSSSTSTTPLPQKSCQDTFQQLLPYTLKVQKNAYCPYSSFHVGCALLASNGNDSSSPKSIFSGCNFENQSFGVTICAERCAIGTMLAELGPSAKIEYLLVVTPNGCACCGACLQVISEFVASPNVPVVLLKREVDLTGNAQDGQVSIKEELEFKDLLPFAINIKEQVHGQ
uniref:CMP/dCMP-type deaminase domain-containing protein n=1 Tax=Percolomonas cosmopolitus TaxID=63605 RepID=A0A7S1KTU0_9EUKA|mmetsp:Transcript_8793/g.32528  ORF Transcript_8793/g.32528 Transcript_8793/m.32528 type:complete len:171 (+) Transcript_8793:46-558(+)|eukprot:CAMPEP_0117451928 /NCGR_PEP_ID=MMETSP0759-20121206/9295_1 /TAXON_ID=63605 /ORGANISM="Percolomonas cosmopolitus, Strain WS" /LENGTH=170 /DNA_ID=CAMNT_0005244613 /DNA_START=19 /DNA_END=531 /DNA_ORIENTATION=+